MVSPEAKAQDLLPDLVVQPSSLEDTEYDSQTLSGRTLLRLSTGVANIGAGPLEVRSSGLDSADRREVVQRVYDFDGGWSESFAGAFIYHPTHGHFHFEDWVTFRLREALPDGGVGAAVAESDKVSFCLLDLLITEFRLRKFR